MSKNLKKLGFPIFLVVFSRPQCGNITENTTEKYDEVPKKKRKETRPSLCLQYKKENKRKYTEDITFSKQNYQTMRTNYKAINYTAIEKPVGPAKQNSSIRNLVDQQRFEHQLSTS